MYKRPFQYLLLIVCSMFFLAACTNEKKESDPTTPPEEVDNHDEGQEVDQEEEGELGEEDGQTTEEDAADEAASSENQAELPAPIEVNEELHVDGITMKVEKITFHEKHISVDFYANNSSGNAVYLANRGRALGDELGGITLVDDTGFEYRYIAEYEDHQIFLNDMEEIIGSISFMGKLRDDARSLTLIFNPGETNNPVFTFEDIEIKR